VEINQMANLSLHQADQDIAPHACQNIRNQDSQENDFKIIFLKKENRPC
jgi:hypothetical protein